MEEARLVDRRTLMGDIQDLLARPPGYPGVSRSQALLNEEHARTPTQSPIHRQTLTRTPSIGSILLSESPVEDNGAVSKGN